MGTLKFKAVNGVNVVGLQDTLDNLTLTAVLDAVKLEADHVIDVSSQDPFDAADTTNIVNAVESLGAVHYDSYASNKKAEIDAKTATLIGEGHTYLTKHYNLDLITQHNIDALGGNFSDNVIERMFSAAEDLATAYAVIQGSTYPARVSTSDGGYTSFTTHTDYMAFKNSCLGRIKDISYGGQDKRGEVDALTYGDFNGVDGIVDNRT